MEIRKYCPEVFDKIEVLVDGGIKRGTDVVKALCLGARGVGIGRAALYGLAAGGPAGVERTLESEGSFCMWFKSSFANYIGSAVLDEELKTAMRLLGAHNVRELGLHHVSILSSP